MKKENIIEKIVEGNPIVQSTELLKWIEESDENQKEYIRYKNTWALLQRGKEMDKALIDNDFSVVKAKINGSTLRVRFRETLKYAAIIVLAMIGGFFINSLNVVHKISINEISVPSGNRTLIVLPDGSKVWLTNNSKLIYPENFIGKTRDVQLFGEAFFTVAHDAETPFVVHLGKHRVKVLGTEFSIVSYPEDNTIQVDLVSGKVQMDVNLGNGIEEFCSTVLEPLHSLVLDKTSGRLSKSKIQDSFFKYWKEGVYQFENESFFSLSKKIDRIFGVEIIFEDEMVKHRTFTGSFNIDDNIYTMMEVFRRASGKPFSFVIDRNSIFIKSTNYNLPPM